MPIVTKRDLVRLAAAAAIGTAARPAAAQDLPAHERALYDAAKREGEVTWYTGQMQAEPSEALGRAFTARFPGVKVNVVRSASEVMFQRLTQDARAGVAQCDVFSSTDISHATFLKKQNRLTPYKAENAKSMSEPVRKSDDPDGFWQTTYFGLYLLARNSQSVSEADAPTSWKALMDPKWRDKIAMGHPGYSGAIASWCIFMKKQFGWEYFKALERNKPQIGRSSADPITTLAAKERVIGACIPSAATRLSISRGNPIALIYPEEGTLAVPGPSTIQKNAPHPNAAKLFHEFCAGQDYSRISVQFFDESLRPDVPGVAGAPPLNQLKLVTPVPAEVEAQSADVKEAWRDTFGV